MAADTANAASTNAPAATPANNLREITPSLLAPEIGSKLLEPDPEKRKPVFRKDHDQTKR
jgi:hypothetical protein